MKFFLFFAFFYLLRYLYRYINPFVISNIIPVLFLIALYYVFFVKYKTSAIDMFLLSFYYIVYDYVYGNIPFTSITAFLMCYLLLERFKKQTNNDLRLYHYLISGSLFFASQAIILLVFFGISLNLFNICSKLFAFNVLATIFYISEIIDRQKRTTIVF